MTITGHASGTASGMATTLADGVRLSNDLWLADISDTIGALSFDFRVGAVAEFTFPAVDLGRMMAKRGLLREGVTLTVDGHVYQIAAVERDYRGDDIWLTFAARSRLARRLRNMTGGGHAQRDTPQGFITRAVKKAGGTAVVERGAGSMRIVQKRGESMLDVIANIASDTGVEWVEHSNTFWVGTPWWAFQGGTGLPMWTATADGSTASTQTLAAGALQTAKFSSRSSLDDRQQAAEASLTVDAELGRRVRPWHRVTISHADPADNGVWLVGDVSYGDGSPTADLSLSRPLKSGPKKASQQAGGGDLSALDGKWIVGADKVWPRCGRSPRQAVAWALQRKDQGWPDRACLNFVSQAFGKNNLGGGQAHLVWDNAPATAVKDPGNTSPPIGALVCWGTGAGQGAGHIGISIGGGRMVNASGGKVFVTSIAGFTGDYKGAMTPSFWTGG